MKGTFFANKIEYKIDILGESWTQGETVKGSLIVTTHAGGDLDHSKLGCHLCFCNNKKLKTKDSAGIKIVSSQMINEKQSELEFSFDLESDCPITESTGSLYIVCGDIDKPFDIGMLELKIIPNKVITDFVQVFEQYFRFKFKTFKNKKSYLEALVVAPDSKEWTSVQKMIIQLKMKESELEVKFLFNLKKLSFDSTLDKTKDEKCEVIKVLSKKEHTLYGSANQEVIKKILTEVLDTVKLKPLIS